MFWAMIGCAMISFLVLLFRRRWVVLASVVASAFIIVGVWLERFLIVVPTLTKTAQQGYKAGMYHPSWVEWSITLGCLSAFVLMYVVFAKLFPVISIWEVREGRDAVSHVTERVETYLPAETEIRKSA